MGKNGNIHPKRIFKTPEEMQEAWDGYKLWLQGEAQRWLKVQYVGKEGDRKTDAQKVPFTLEGFKRYCRNNHGDIKEYFDPRQGNEDYYADFSGITSHIREEIREDQIIGGALGFYNSNIIARLNGLADKKEVDGKLDVTQITGMEVK